MSEEVVDILIKHLSMTDYIKVTKEIVDLELDLKKCKDMLEEIKNTFLKAVTEMEITGEGCVNLSELLDKIEKEKVEE